MATVNFFRIMLGLPSLKIQSTDPGIIPCDGGSLSASGGTGNFNFRAITVGEGIGFVDTTWNAIGQIDRFQIIWNNQIVADSLFVGDSLSSGASGQISDLATALSNGFQENNWNDQTQTFDSTGNTIYPNINPYPTTACLWEGGSDGSDDRIVYNIAPTGSLYDRNDNSLQTPSGTGGNAPSQGYYENANGQGLAAPASGCPASDYKQIGVVADYPNANSKSWDGNIKLQFYKDAQFPEIIELRVWGTGGTAWNLTNLTCPGGELGEIQNISDKQISTYCWNYGGMSNSDPARNFPWNSFSYGNQNLYYANDIGAAKNLSVGDVLYSDQNLSNPWSLLGTGNTGYMCFNDNDITQAVDPPDTSNVNNAIPAYQALNWTNANPYPSTSPPPLKFFREWYVTGSNAGVITNITNNVVWKSITMKYVNGTGWDDLKSISCGYTSSLTPDTTYYFNSAIQNSIPQYNDVLLTSNPGQPTGTDTDPWREYDEGLLDSSIPDVGWYVANSNSSCQSNGMPAKILLFIGDNGQVLFSPTNTGRNNVGVCYKY